MKEKILVKHIIQAQTEEGIVVVVVVVNVVVNVVVVDVVVFTDTVLLLLSFKRNKEIRKEISRGIKCRKNGK